MLKRLKSTKGDGHVSTVIMIMVFMIMFSFILSAVPVFTTKMNLNNFANEMVREAEIAGRIGSETSARYNRMCESTGITPSIEWSRSGKVQIGEEIAITVSTSVDIGFFVFGNHPVTISSTASGVSEVFWK